jgi:hypothetical protein
VEALSALTVGTAAPLPPHAAAGSTAYNTTLLHEAAAAAPPSGATTFAAVPTSAAPLPSWSPHDVPRQPPTWLGGGGGWNHTHPTHAFNTMGVTPAVRTEWIAGSGASYHTTPDVRLLSSVRPPHPSYPSTIMVGDGSCLPITSMGCAPSPFHLPNVLVAPQMVHNLLSIRQFIADNYCSVEFDPSGLTVKDSMSGSPLLRCDSSGPLCTLRLPASATSHLPSSPSAALVTTPSSTTWHRRLGHPGRDTLAQLSHSAQLPCTRASNEHLCHACQLGRHVRLPFSSSSSHATHAFDLVHCDMWTSPVPSLSGYKYYLVIIDDFSHYS